MKKHKIVSIDIELEDFEPIHLKLSEAKELYEQLHELFGSKSVNYVPWYTQPYYWLSNNNQTTWTATSGFVDPSDNVAVKSNTTNMVVSYNCEAA